MAIVTGMTAERMLAIEAASVVDGVVDSSGELVLTKHDGTEIYAGHVKGDKGDQGDTRYLSVTDTDTVDLTLTGTGTQADPWNIKADTKTQSKLMQLAGNYIGPGPAMVTDVGLGLGTQYGPYEWVGQFDPTGNPVVRVQKIDGTYVITGHAQGNSVGGWRLIPLAPGWVPYGLSVGGSRFGPFSEFMPVVKTPAGIVSMQGMARAIGSKTGPVLITTLPPDMRPDNILIFHANNSDTVGEVRVNPDGTVWCQSNLASAQWVDLSSVCFPAAGVATWTPIPVASYANGCSDYGQAQFGVASYWTDPYGVTWWNGLIKLGTSISATTFATQHICALPAGVTPLDSQHETVAGAGQTFSAVRFTGTVTSGQPVGWLDWLTSAGPGNWISLAGLTTLTPQGQITLAPYIFDPTAMMTLGNAWVSYGAAGGGNQPAFLIRRPDGLNMGIGLMKGGTIGAVAFGIPERMSPKGTILMQNASNTARGRIDIIGSVVDAAGTTYGRTIMAAQGSAAWYSLDGAKWYSGGA